MNDNAYKVDVINLKNILKKNDFNFVVLFVSFTSNNDVKKFFKKESVKNKQCLFLYCIIKENDIIENRFLKKNVNEYPYLQYITNVDKILIYVSCVNISTLEESYMYFINEINKN